MFYGKDGAALAQILECNLGRKVDLEEEDLVVNGAKLRGGGKRFSCSSSIPPHSMVYVNGSTNSSGRITYLSLHTRTNGTYINSVVNLPADIRSLDKLKELVVCGCPSLPQELALLPNLEKLSLDQCSLRSRSFWDVEFPKMKRLHITLCESMDFDLLLLLFQWIKERAPLLQNLFLRGTTTTTTTSSSSSSNMGRERARDQQQRLDVLSNNVDFHTSLNKINLRTCGIDEHRLATLLFQVLPSFPKVSVLNVSNNNIRSFRPIQTLLEKDKSLKNSYVSKPTLMEIYLHHNPLCSSNTAHPEESRALCRFLCSCSTISYLRPIEDSLPGVQRELILNMVGRCLVETGSNATPLPLSVWPIVLERVQKLRRLRMLTIKKDFVATGIFYLLRNGPLLNRSNTESNCKPNFIPPQSEN